MNARGFAIGLAAMSLFAALPAAASATDYCVVPNAGCGGTNVDTLDKALDYADNDPGADRIFLGAFNYVAPSAGGFDYSKDNSPVEIVGKGAGQTVLTAPSGASGVLRLFGSADSSVRDLRIEIPANVAPNFNGLATDGVARRIDVTDTQPQVGTDRTGVRLENGGRLEDSSVVLQGLSTRGVWTDSGGGTVRGSSVEAYFAISSAYGATIERSRVFTSGGGIIAGRNLTTVENSVIAVGQGGFALGANPQPGSPATIEADGITILAPDRVNSRAAWAATPSAPDQNAEVDLTNSIIRGGKVEAHAAGPGHASIAISYSDLEPGSTVVLGAPYASVSLSNTTNVSDAGFADLKLGDFHLLPSSPLVDAGDPNAASGSDLDGKPRIVDGNGDGTARRDMGAYEYQTGVPADGGPPPEPPVVQPSGGAPLDTQAPLVDGFRATPSLFALARAATPVSARTARGTRFRYALSEAARVTIRIQRVRPGRRYVSVGTLRRAAAKGANSVRFTGRIGRRALRPGRYRAVISATDAAGNRSTPRRASFRIAPS